MQHEQYQIRAEKRARLLREGNDPYPVELPVTSSIKEVRAKYVDLEAGEETDDIVGLVGRVIFSRNTGKLCFVTLQDGEGETLQVMLSAREVGPENLEAYKADVDLGDIMFAHGRVISSRRGELSVMAAPGKGKKFPRGRWAQRRYALCQKSSKLKMARAWSCQKITAFAAATWTSSCVRQRATWFAAVPQ